MLSTIHAQYKGALGATRAPETAFLPSQGAWWRHAKRGFRMSLLLPTATQATPTIRYRLIIYKEWVAEVAVFVAKKSFSTCCPCRISCGCSQISPEYLYHIVVRAIRAMICLVYSMQSAGTLMREFRRIAIIYCCCRRDRYRATG